MTEIDGWTCEVTPDGTRTALGPADAQGHAFLAMYPDSLRTGQTEVPASVVEWLTDRPQVSRLMAEAAAAEADRVRVRGLIHTLEEAIHSLAETTTEHVDDYNALRAGVRAVRLAYVASKRGDDYGRTERLEAAFFALPCPECRETIWAHKPDCSLGAEERRA